MNDTFGGFALGLISVLFVGIMVKLFVRRRMNPDGREYDERQIAVQGKAYKISYFTLLIALTVGGLLFGFEGKAVCSPFTLVMISMALSLGVFITICIFKDAYFALRPQRKNMLILFLILGGINLFAGFRRLGDSPETAAVSLCAGGLLLYACIIIGIKTLLERKAGDE